MNKRIIRCMWIVVALLATTLWIVACGATPEPTAVEPTQPPATPTAAEPTQPPATLTAAEPTEPPAVPAAVEPTQPPAEEKLFPPEMPSGVRGKAIFEANCVNCHGAAGDGSGLAGAADFTDLASL